MKRKIGFRASVILLGLLMSCLSVVNACKPLIPDISVRDEAAIYAAAIRQIYEKDDTYGGSLRPPVVYLVRKTDDSVGDPDIENSESKVLEETILSGISSALEDLPTELIWVEDEKDVVRDPDTGQVAGEGVIITLGNVHPQRDGSVHISGSIFIASLAAGGKTYIVQQVDGLWKVTGTTGVQWIS